MEPKSVRLTKDNWIHVQCAILSDIEVLRRGTLSEAEADKLIERMQSILTEINGQVNA